MSDELKTGNNAAGIVFALLSVVAFGLLVPYAKVLLGTVAPLPFASVLLLGAGVGMGFVLLVRTLARKAPVTEGLEKSNAPKLALMVVLNAAAVACLAFGVSHVFAANASLLMGFETAAAVVCAWIFFHRHVCLKAIAAVALICLASLLLFWNVGSEAVFVPESAFLVVACALRGFEGGLKRSLASKDPLQVACVRSLGAGVVLLVVALVAGGGFPPIDAASTGAVALLGFVTFGFGAFCHLSAQRNLGPARSEAYFSFAPFAGLLISWFIFGLEVEPLFFGALALMALGVWLAMDDSVFHEDALADLNDERLMLYTGEVTAFGFDTLHRPL